MTIKPQGIHHVTAIARDPQQNVDFYTKVLGLRLVKQTVNFDAPHVWHLYYGDAQGSPSSILTFFPWPGISKGKDGAGLTTATAFSIPASSLSFWSQHLSKLGVDWSWGKDSEANDLLELRDHDGMRLQLVGTNGDARSGWDGVGSIPAEHAVRGLHAVELSERTIDPTAGMLENLLGMKIDSESSGRANFSMGSGASGAKVEVLGGVQDRGLQAGGTVHHVAFSAPDLQTMELWQQELLGRGAQVTQIMDRQYFKSIYFREPGGVLFEIATDDPGFAIDEPLLELGRKLRLPPWLEPSRDQIEASLPPIRL
ncbi:MAG: ring-cleaving dioxygenase [Actinobacteria bacterium]|nr:ring-cleaving dioxygenase [Actinomycetota bacterium]